MSGESLAAMHSAEHLLNSTMVKLFGCQRSFSAHLNKKKSKCDYHFPRPLTDTETAEIEKQVNGVISKNLPITEEAMDRESASRVFDLKRLPDSVGDQLRIISIGNYDTIPCIGEHLSCTGKIGRFRITTTSFEEGVLRIRFKLSRESSSP